MAQEPNNSSGSAGFGSDSSSALALFRRLSSQTVASSFQPQKTDQFGFLVYNRSNVAIASLSTPLGANATASGNRSTAIGAFAIAREDSSTAVGIYAQALGPSSIAIGDQAKATAYRTIAIGPLANATGINSFSLGIRSVASGRESVAIGDGAVASGRNAVAIGVIAEASSTSAVAIGNNAVARQANTVAIGTSASVISTNGIAIGDNASVANFLHFSSVALGSGATTTAQNQMMIGSSTANPLSVVVDSGDLTLNTLGNRLMFKEGTNAAYGRVTLSGAGTAIIYTTKKSATAQIMLTPQNASGVAGSVSITTSVTGVSATVGSTNVADTRTVAWLLLDSA